MARGKAMCWFPPTARNSKRFLDPVERRKAMVKLQRILQEDGPLVQPIFRSNFTFMYQSVKGFLMHPTAYIFGNEFGIES
jgi:peptide/nickel transport system substrate-binding protein